MKRNNRLPWRCSSPKMAKDKADIYNSREWRELRLLKLSTNPLCENCKKNGFIVSAHCVHHIIPIETARTKEEMKRLAFDFNNTQSLCDKCHADIHKAAGMGTKQLARERAKQRQDRWVDGIINRFTKKDAG